MATYTTLKLGSSGSAVSTLQKALEDAGYSVGSSGVDGIYGSDTQAAVKAYQKAKGLTVDGIAGTQTLSSLYASSSGSSGSTSSSSSASSTSGTSSTSSSGSVSTTYDPASDEAYQKALAALNDANANTPTYAGTYDSQLEALYEQIMNRDKFSYDLNADMLYQQYKDQYMNLGQQAMRDTMGQAAGLTGGYGSTYAESVGQQQYNAYLQQLNDVIPELYQMALDQYNAEGDRLTNQYSVTSDMASDEYDKYLDAYNQWLTEREYYQGLADTEYDRGYQSWSDSYSAQQDAFSKLYTLIAASGYSPTDEELAAAGMTRQAANALIAAYQQSLASGSSGGSGGSSGGSSGSSSSSLDLDGILADIYSNTSSSKSSGSYSNVASGVTTAASQSTAANKSASSTTKSLLSTGTAAATLTGVSSNYTTCLAKLKAYKANGKTSRELHTLLNKYYSEGKITLSEVSKIKSVLGLA